MVFKLTKIFLTAEYDKSRPYDKNMSRIEDIPSSLYTLYPGQKRKLLWNIIHSLEYTEVIRDRSKFTGYLGRVLGKICVKEKSASPLPMFFEESRRSPFDSPGPARSP